MSPPCCQWALQRKKRRNTPYNFPQLACGVFRQEPTRSSVILLHKLQKVMCCAFCHVRLSQWKQEDNPFEEHKRWGPSCEYMKVLFVGNIPVGSNNEPSARSRDVCGSSRGKYLCLYLFFYMCMFFIAFLSNFQYVLYSWTAKKIQTQDN